MEAHTSNISVIAVKQHVYIDIVIEVYEERILADSGDVLFNQGLLWDSVTLEEYVTSNLIYEVKDC